jgi:acetyl esterase/lipase
MVPGGAWALDTYLRAGETGLTLLDRGRTHPAGQWHTAALTYDGRSMTHYVDGARELAGEVAFPPLRDGRTSIGVRQNRVSWFKGRIHTIRISPEALPSERLLRPPATGRQVIPLWPEGVPGGKSASGGERLVDGRVYNVHNPTLTYVPAAPGTATGASVIVCPGGSYARLAIANEAEGVAARLSARGIAAFILKYRLVEYGHPAPLQDVLRAVRLVRARAAGLGLRGDRVGVMGASAGGHLAASAATLYDGPEGRTGDALDRTSARPDFVALLYPVITMEPPFAHADSRRNLLGSTPDPRAVERLSIHRQVHRDMPPVFLVHTAEDASVPIENSLLLVDALRKSGVPVEAHFYERGPHGFGTRADLGPASGWVDRWFEWMQAHRWLGEHNQ